MTVNWLQKRFLTLRSATPAVEPHRRSRGLGALAIAALTGCVPAPGATAPPATTELPTMPDRLPARSEAGPAPHRLLIGVGIHRNAPDFDPARTAALIALFGLDGVRDEIGNAGFDHGPANPDHPARALPALARLRDGTIGPGDVVTLTGGGSGRYAGGLPVQTADRGSYAGFAAQVAGMSRNTALTLELFNEWNLPTAKRAAGTPEDYAAIVRQTVPAIRAQSPRSAVLVGAIGNDFSRTGGGVVYNDWTRRFIATGAWALGDALSVHLYANCFTGADRLPARMIDRLNDTERALAAANGGRPFPIDVTEVGWPATQGACGFTPDERRAFPAQFLLMAAAQPWLRGVWFYELRDAHTGAPDIEANFGIVADDYRLKPEGCGLFYAIRLARIGVAGAETTAGVTSVHLASGARVVWASGGGLMLPVPPGQLARPLCAAQDQHGGMVALSSLPVVIYGPADVAVARALGRPFGG